MFIAGWCVLAGVLFYECNLIFALLYINYCSLLKLIALIYSDLAILLKIFCFIYCVFKKCFAPLHHTKQYTFINLKI